MMSIFGRRYDEFDGDSRPMRVGRDLDEQRPFYLRPIFILPTLVAIGLFLIVAKLLSSSGSDKSSQYPGAPTPPAAYNGGSYYSYCYYSSYSSYGNCWYYYNMSYVRPPGGDAYKSGNYSYSYYDYYDYYDSYYYTTTGTTTSTHTKKGAGTTATAKPAPTTTSATKPPKTTTTGTTTKVKLQSSTTTATTTKAAR
mmetsp:Transcript_19744/g.35786  ORF Transcript_19744/g.35786 Transcript_19744/m.35786 type:complete len:196 (-) Transcript_19744:221-808(-)